MTDGGPLRAHVRAITGVIIENSIVRAATIESQEITAFSCTDHPEFLWNGSQWGEVLRHLAADHPDIVNNGRSEELPFHDGSKVGEQVQVGVEPPGGEESEHDDNPQP